MISQKLSEARVYEIKKEAEIAIENRPVFHLTPRVGWLNDPNGFSFYDGLYHLFYQYNPYRPFWGPMHWGHVISRDLLHWTYQPAVLAPDQPYDNGNGCFSGSAQTLDDGRQILLYTGVSWEKQSDGSMKEIQQQCIASGDGEVYEKYEKNPVISSDQLPKGYDRSNFRDPKLWKEKDGSWRCVTVSRNETNGGGVLLFESSDCISWKFKSVMAENMNRFGRMWECPDFFCLDGAYVLITSPQDLSADEEFHNGNNSVYYMGNYDKNQHMFHYDAVYSLDDGLDFYAPQTMLADDGRRIMIAWMQSWDSNIRPEGQKWSGMMILPRELKVKDGKILQRPVREIENYHRNGVRYEKQEVQGTCRFDGIKGRVLDMTVEIAGGDFREFTISVAQNEQFHTDFSILQHKNRIEIDRTYSGMVRDANAIRRVKVKTPCKKWKLRIILDKYSMEVFLNDGQQVFSTTFYTSLEADQISFACDGKAIVNLEKYDIVVA